MNLRIILLAMTVGLLASLCTAQPNLVYPGPGGPGMDGCQMNYPCANPCQFSYPGPTGIQLNYPCSDPYQCGYQCSGQCGGQCGYPCDYPCQSQAPCCGDTWTGPGQCGCQGTPGQCSSCCTSTCTSTTTSCTTSCQQQQQPLFNCPQPSCSGWQCPGQPCPGPSCTPVGPCNCGYCTGTYR